MPSTIGTEAVIPFVIEGEGDIIGNVTIPFIIGQETTVPVITKPAEQFTTKAKPASPTMVAASGTPTNWTATGLPTGLVINAATGEITGTPTAETGAYTVKLIAENAAGPSEEVSFVWNVEPVVKITKPAKQENVKNKVITPLKLSAVGYKLRNWRITEAKPLPVGLSINSSTGEITGTPTGPVETKVVGVEVESESGGEDKVTFEWAVLAEEVAEGKGKVTKPSEQTTEKNKSASLSIAGTAMVSLVAEGLPTGLTLVLESPTSARISGIVSAGVGAFTVKLKVANAKAEGEEITFIWNVTAEAQAPSLITPSSQHDTVGVDSGTFLVSNIGGAVEANGWTATNLPGGLVLNKTTGVITGTPTTLEEPEVTVTAKNAQGTVSVKFKWRIQEASTIGVGPPVTFTLMSGVPSNIGASFKAGPHGEFVTLKSLLVGGKVVGVTNEYIKEGLRSLGYFEES